MVAAIVYLQGDGMKQLSFHRKKKQYTIARLVGSTIANIIAYVYFTTL